MGLTALLLVLLGAVIHAGWNFAAKKAGGDSRFSFFSIIIMAVVWAPLALSLGWHIVPNWGWLEWLLVALSGLVHWLYFVCLLTGYRKSDFTVVYPLARGSAPLLSSVVAVLVFGEALSALGVAGIMGVAFGVFLIAGGPGLFKAGHDPARHDRLMAGLFWGTATGVLIASYTVLDAYVVKVIAVSHPYCWITGPTFCVCPLRQSPFCATQPRPNACGGYSGNTLQWLRC
jgi:drug/metabolite transporter (DMT)-like permease